MPVFMQKAGLFRVLQPKRWGGYELDILTYFECQMALGEADLSVAWVYGVVGVHPWLLALYDDRAAADVWGADDSTLICSSLMPVGTALPADGGFRLSGHWKYASGCEHTQWAFLGAVPPGGALEERRIFLVPRSDFEIVDTWRVAGLKGTGSHDIVVKDAFVPAHRAVTFSDNFRGWGPGLATNTGPLYRLPFGQVFFRGVSTGAIGALQGMRQLLMKLERGKRLGSFKSRPDMKDADVTLDYVLDNIVIRGTVNAVVDRILEMHEAVGGFGTLLYCGKDWTDVALGRRSMELMAEKVMPTVNAALGRRVAAE